MPFTIDHIVIAVADLDAAARDYEALGFTVLPGGEHRALHPFAAPVRFEKNLRQETAIAVLLPASEGELDPFAEHQV